MHLGTSSFFNYPISVHTNLFPCFYLHNKERLKFSKELFKVSRENKNDDENKNTNNIKTYDIYTHLFLILSLVNYPLGWKNLFLKWMMERGYTRAHTHTHTHTHVSRRDTSFCFSYLFAPGLSTYFRRYDRVHNTKTVS